jgi:Fatty acid desaturase
VSIDAIEALRDHGPETDEAIRAAMPRSRALTWLIGKPFRGEPVPRLTPSTQLAAALVSLTSGITLTVCAIASRWLVLLIPGWAMTLHGARNLRMMIYHQCAHRNMWNRRRSDMILGKLIAGLLMVQNFDRYQSEHVTEHHARHHMTLRDPTVQAFLIGLGLHPGMTRRQMWRRVLRKLLSPAFHLQFLWARVRSYYRPASGRERACAVTAYACVLLLISWLHAWPELLVAWVVPLSVMFQVSNTLRLCVKHTFPAPDHQERRGRQYFSSLTNAIFLGDPVPDPSLRGLRRTSAWVRWWLRIAVVHFPARYLVLTGDTVCHDYHHRHPMDRNWASYIYARQADIDAGHPGWPAYRSVWGGLIAAINLVFDSLAAADPAYYQPAELARVNQRELFAAFDD